jgi:cation:H+ antiporter
MPVAFSVLLFAAAAAVSLGTSYLLVTRLERLGQRLGLSEALLGMVAALAADAPEITSAVTALVRHQGKIGAGVIIGSNVFNLAALLGLGAVVAGRLALHRKVVLLGGVVAGWIALACLITVLGLIPASAGLAAVLAVLLPYVAVLAMGGNRLRRRRPVLGRAAAWLAVAVTEEEQELEEAIHPRRGHITDLLMAAMALVIVVLASVLMEREASELGSHFGIPEIITGGFVLAAVTSLPNAVAAVYLAARGRGAAMLSTTLNSNALNVAAGLLLPAVITGLGSPSPEASLIAAWYLVLTVAALGFAYRDRGMHRATGFFIIGSYLVFLGSLAATARSDKPGLSLALVPLLMVIVATCAVLTRRPGRRERG